MSVVSDHPAWQVPNILDIRPVEPFIAGHLRGATSLPLEARGDWPGAAGLTSSYLAAVLPSYLLPPGYEPLAVVASNLATAQRVCALLAERGRLDLAAWSLVADEAASLPAELIATGPSDRHLWRPPAFLTEWAHLLPPPAAGEVLDLACGSGRSAVWLAQRGYRVTAVDRLPTALDRGRQLAESCGVSCRFEVADLRDSSQVPPGPWAVVLMLRYLQRDLLVGLGDLLAPAAVAVVRTFRHAGGFDGKPSRRHRLAPAELPGYFPCGQFTLLVYEENHDPDGRPAAGVVARREGGSFQ